MSSNVISLRVDTAIKTRLDKLSASTGRPRTYYIQEAIKRQLDEIEYIYGLEQQATNILAGNEPTYSLDEVVDELGLED